MSFRNGTIEGRGILTYSADSFCSKDKDVEKVNGTFVDGKLSGMATVHFTNQSIFRAPFNRGSISGLGRMFSCQYGVCDFSVESWNVPNWLSRVSRPGIVPPPATQSLTQLLGSEGETEKGQRVYLPLDERTYRMNIHTASTGSKEGGFGCLFHF